MSYPLRFTRQTRYDLSLPGITVDVTLSLGPQTITFPAKLDTDSTNCVFARRHAEALGLSVEAGEPMRY